MNLKKPQHPLIAGLLLITLLFTLSNYHSLEDAPIQKHTLLRGENNAGTVVLVSISDKTRITEFSESDLTQVSVHAPSAFIQKRKSDLPTLNSNVLQ